jgi:hypothetical protein
LIIQGLRCPPQVYPPVSPLCHGGLSISSACPAHGGLPSIPPPQVHRHPHGGVEYHANQYGGFPLPSDQVPSVVYGGAPWSPAGPPSLGYHHVPASVGPTGDFPGSSVVFLAHEDPYLSSASDVTTSLLVAGRAVPQHLDPPSARPVPFPPGAPQLLPLVATMAFLLLQLLPLRSFCR